MRTFPILVLLLTLACHGCVTQHGDSTLTGPARPAIPTETVKIFTEKPSTAIDVGIIRAYSVGWTPDKASRTLTTNLLMQAAKLGAEGVIIKTFHIDCWSGSNAEGLAFHVPEKKD